MLYVWNTQVIRKFVITGSEILIWVIHT